MNSQEIIERYYDLMGDGGLFPPIHNVMPCVFAAAGVGRYLFSYYKLKRQDPVSLIITGDGGSVCYLSQSRLTEITEVAFGLFCRDHGDFKNLINEFNQLGEEIISEYEALKESIRTNFEASLPKVKAAIEKSKRQNAISWFTLHVDQELLAGLIKGNNIQISAERLEEIWPSISMPYSESLDKRRRRAILTRIIAGEDFEKIAKSFQFYFQNYNDYTREEEALSKLQEEYKNIDSETAALELAALDKEKDELGIERSRVESELSADEKNIFEFLQEAIRVRDMRKDYIVAALSLQLIWTEQAAIKVGIEPQFTSCILMEEAERGSEYLAARAHEITLRPEGFIMMMDIDENAHYCLVDNAGELRREVEHHFLDQAEEASMVKGTPAYKGKISGRVRIIRDAAAQTIDKGDVLVTGMTRPEFVPLMKLAGAIVTDEGGITCHAAIIARELKIPCVIGTRNATKVLKENDMVEVDADKGIVTIVN